MSNNRRTSRPENGIHISKKATGLSQFRKDQINEQIETGQITQSGINYDASRLMKTASATPIRKGNTIHRGSWVEGSQGNSARTERNISAVASIVKSSNMNKMAETYSYRPGASSGTGSGAGGSVSSDRLMPEVYSPFYTMANMNIPRDRTVINAWIRAFYDLNPIVRNAITLHATYPISKIMLRCDDKKVLSFFEDMVEEIDLIGIIGMVALEFFKHGEVFPYCELDETNGKWKSVTISNPDFINVRRTPFASEPIISMRPDTTLQRIVMSGSPIDMRLRQQIDPKILHFVKSGADIPLDNLNISHLKMLSAPYDIRGTSIVVSVFKDVILYDKYRECFRIDTEFLTENGFKFYDEITPNCRLATLNSTTQEIEFQNYTDRIKQHYEGELYHFHGKKIDLQVTPGHRMWLAQKEIRKIGYKNFEIIEAENVRMGHHYRSQATAKWMGNDIEEVDVLGNKVPINEYLEFLGYLLAEGCIQYNEQNYNYKISINQSVNSPHFNIIRNCFLKFGKRINTYVGTQTQTNNKGFSINRSNIMTAWYFTNKILTKHFFDEIGKGSYNKRIPYWVKQLSPNRLKVLLSAMVIGDGSVLTKDRKGVGYRYNTASKQLADDVQEILFKCGEAPKLSYVKNNRGAYYYIISWSTAKNGKNPIIYGNAEKKGHTGASIKKVPYKGDVVCFSVPNELLVVRRNGVISIQGNCKFAQADSMVNPITLIKVGGTTEGEYKATQEDLEFYREIFEQAQNDKDFKIITHGGMTVERAGSAGQVIDVTADIEHIVKNIYTGLMVPQAVVDTESAVYSSASIGLEVLRQRYFNFRNMMAKWLQNKVFAPISEIQNLYKYENGKKRLIVPEIEWNKMNLYDLQDYIGNITGLLGTKQVSLQTVYKSLGLNYEEERIKQRKEMINEAIALKEQQALADMSLDELRTLDPEKYIENSATGEGSASSSSGGAGATPESGGGAPDLGGLPELAPPTPPSGGAPSSGGMPEGGPLGSPPSV